MGFRASKDGSIRIKLLSVIVGSVIASILAAILILSSNTVSLAASPAMINDTPLGETSNVFGIQKIVVANTTSPADALELQANPRGKSIDFVATNRGSIPVVIDVDKWTVNANIYGIRDSRIIDESLNTVVNSGDRLVLQTLDLSEYRSLLEYYPGTHTFELSGLKWTTELVGPYLNVTTGTNINVINIEARVTVDYDQGILKSSANKLLKADAMRMSVAGTGPAFEVSDKNPKNVSFFYVNEGSSNLNFRPTHAVTTTWMADDRFPDDMVLTNIHADNRSCINLKPGDSIEIGRLQLSTNQSPIGGNGIAHRHNSDVAIPGVYIINHIVDLLPCDPLTESTLTPQSSIYAAFEVKQ
jgi:hypothetical protein